MITNEECACLPGAVSMALSPWYWLIDVLHATPLRCEAGLTFPRWRADQPAPAKCANSAYCNRPFTLAKQMLLAT